MYYAVNPSCTRRCVAIDCEMVGIHNGKINMLARVSLVDESGYVLYDTFVRPQQKVTDYRTKISGVRPVDMEHGEDFSTVRQIVYHIIHGKLLVGHAILNDLKVLCMSYPKELIRDTSTFHRFIDHANGRTPSLKYLAFHLLGINIQAGEHNSVEDARATMCLYLKYRQEWETYIANRYN